MNKIKFLLSIVLVLLLSACQSYQPKPLDYTYFKASQPKSILVVPPLNESTDVKATWGMLAATTKPLSEAGYYVFPVALVNETFRQNGLTTAADIHQVNLRKLQEIFNNDAVLYIIIRDYGTQYQIIQSVTTVSADARLVDARNGRELWTGSVHFSESSNQNNNLDLGSALINAVVHQIVNTLHDRGYLVARAASQQLLSPNKFNGILYGPRSPHYQEQLLKP